MRIKEEIIEKLKRHAAAHGTTPEAVIEAALAKEIDLTTPRAKQDSTDRLEAFAVLRRRRHPLD